MEFQIGTSGYRIQKWPGRSVKLQMIRAGKELPEKHNAFFMKVSDRFFAMSNEKGQHDLKEYFRII